MGRRQGRGTSLSERLHVVPGSQQTLVPGRHQTAILNRLQTAVSERQTPGLNQGQSAVPETANWEDTSLLDFARQGSGLAQAKRATDRGGADELAARGWGGRRRRGPVKLNGEDGRPDLGIEVTRERGRTAGGEAKHGYAHPAREADAICRARWDILRAKRLLILSYIPSGLQIWDCTDLGTVTEVLNLNFYQRRLAEFDVGSVIYAALLASPVEPDSFKEDRPFLGMILELPQDPESTALVG